MRIEKLFMIYQFIQCDENNAKLFDVFATYNKVGYWDFMEHTEEENRKYLLKWKKDNNIKLSDFLVAEEIKQDAEKLLAENKIPVLCKRVNKNEKKVGLH